MIAKGKNVSVVILDVDDATLHEMWCFTKHLHGCLEDFKKTKDQMKERIVEFCPSKKKSKNSNNPRDNNSEHNKVQIFRR